MHFDVVIANNTFFEDAGSSAVSMFSAKGITVTGNVVTRAAGTPTPAFDFGCGASSCSEAVVAGNACNGGACVVVGLPPATA